MHTNVPVICIASLGLTALYLYVIIAKKSCTFSRIGSVKIDYNEFWLFNEFNVGKQTWFWMTFMVPTRV